MRLQHVITYEQCSREENTQEPLAALYQDRKLGDEIVSVINTDLMDKSLLFEYFQKIDCIWIRKKAICFVWQL